MSHRTWGNHKIMKSTILIIGIFFGYNSVFGQEITINENVSDELIILANSIKKFGTESVYIKLIE